MTSTEFRAREELCAVDLEAASAEDVLRALAAKAEDAGMVQPTFTEALIERERIHPTALPTAVPVAIPHADAEHVNAGGVAVATLAKPVSFGVMGGAGAEVPVNIVFMLLVPEPHEQVKVLTRLIDMVQRPSWETTLQLAQTPVELAAAFNAALGVGA